MTVYVLHFSPAYKHAEHYVGYTPERSADRRIDEHLRGAGSPLVRAALAAGSEIRVAHVFKNAGRDFERNLKDRRDVRSWCPVCNVRSRPIPSPKRMSARFLGRKGGNPYACEAAS